MKILFLLRYSRSKASSRVRGYNIADRLESMGHLCRVISGNDLFGILRKITEFSKFDIIFFQKRYRGFDIILNKIASAMGRTTFFDIDDAPAGNTNIPRAAKQAKYMMKNSSAVIVGSHSLKSLAGGYNKNNFLVPSSIDLSIYKPRQGMKKGSPVTLGWIGDGASYASDLQLIREPVERLGENQEIRLVIAGALGQEEIHENFSRISSVSTELLDYIDWDDPKAIPSVISKFDIGLYPLINNEFNKFKCGYKALEYMAMGVPVVASPVGENQHIIDNDRNGFLVESEEEWYRALSRLADDRQLRLDMGVCGRDDVVKRYSLEICAEKIEELFVRISGKEQRSG